MLRVPVIAAVAVLAQTVPAAPDLGRVSPELTALFTPAAVPAGTYLVFESSRPLPDLVKALAAADASHSGGEWEIERPEGAGAFGRHGTADRARLALLFGGARVARAHGSIRDAEGVTAYTLISPYPAPSLSEIREGTMVIRFVIPKLAAR